MLQLISIYFHNFTKKNSIHPHSFFPRRLRELLEKVSNRQPRRMERQQQSTAGSTEYASVRSRV